jgi:hypothetical protein
MVVSERLRQSVLRNLKMLVDEVRYPRTAVE